MLIYGILKQAKLKKNQFNLFLTNMICRKCKVSFSSSSVRFHNEVPGCPNRTYITYKTN